MSGHLCPEITQGVIPSLHVYYINTHLKQYHKTCGKGAALRTETTINNTCNFHVGRPLKKLPQLREIGFAANRCILEAFDSKLSASSLQGL